MARRLRLHVPGGFYHVTVRGNHRQPIFFAASDRDRLDDIVAEATDHVAARIHAYCWMTNHIHILVQISDAPLGKLIQRIASRYARAVQARLETTGHLFERRYHAILVDADAYLMTLVRYIHLNPVRGGLVADPAEYPWSSHRNYLGLCQRDWVTTKFTLGVLGNHPDHAVAKYRELMDGPGPSHWGEGDLIPNRDAPEVLGSKEFVLTVKGSDFHPRSHKSLDDVMRECSEQFKETSNSLASKLRSPNLAIARAWIGHEALKGRIASVSEVAKRLGRTEGCIRYLMKQHPHDSDEPNYDSVHRHQIYQI